MDQRKSLEMLNNDIEVLDKKLKSYHDDIAYHRNMYASLKNKARSTQLDIDKLETRKIDLITKIVKSAS